MEQMKTTNYARFLTFVRILVDETRRDSPLTQNQILSMCEEAGASVTRQTFNSYIRCMAEAGVFIRYKTDRNGTKHYWYDQGWI